jgi:hypothetical protein
MNFKLAAEYLIVGLPYVMAGVFIMAVFSRIMMWYTVKRHEWFARQVENRVNRFIAAEVPGKNTRVSFYVLSKRILECTYYEVFALRDRVKRRNGDVVMTISDRIFLIKPGCAWMVKDILNQLKFLKWTSDTPKLQQITRSTLLHNPFFNRVFGVYPIAAVNDLVSVLPGLFVIAGILGTFIGIAGGLQDLGGMNLQDLENTKNVMDRFLHEIAFAMKTSIFGIMFSLCTNLVNTVFSPERVYVELIDRFESSLDLLWYRSDNNDFPSVSQTFNEHRDPAEALAEDAINIETKRHPGDRAPTVEDKPKAS